MWRFNSCNMMARQSTLRLAKLRLSKTTILSYTTLKSTKKISSFRSKITQKRQPTLTWWLTSKSRLVKILLPLLPKSMMEKYSLKQRAKESNSRLWVSSLLMKKISSTKSSILLFYLLILKLCDTLKTVENSCLTNYSLTLRYRSMIWLSIWIYPSYPLIWEKSLFSFINFSPTLNTMVYWWLMWISILKI